MKVDAQTLIRRKFFRVELPHAGRLGFKEWFLIQIIGLAVTLAGALTVTVTDES